MNDLTNKRPLILWSGGFDSTCLVIDRLQEGDIDLLYVNLENNDRLQRHEKKAIAKMKVILKDANLKGNIINEYKFGYQTITVTKELYAQPALWLQAASMTADGAVHDEVLIAYVRQDDVWHYRTEVMNAYNALNQLTCPDNIVPVKFPYEWETKSGLLERFKDFVYIKQILNLIYYCESGTKEPCGECGSCKRHNDDLKGDDKRIMAVDMTDHIMERTKEKENV